jgi:hypothetical protein
MYLNFFNSLFIFLFFFSIFYISSAERRGKPKKGRLFVRPGHTTTTSIDKKKTKIEPRVKNKPIHWTKNQINDFNLHFFFLLLKCFSGRIIRVKLELDQTWWLSLVLLLNRLCVSQISVFSKLTAATLRIWEQEKDIVVTITTLPLSPSLELSQCPIVSSVSESRWFHRSSFSQTRESELHNRCNLHKLYQMTGALVSLLRIIWGRRGEGNCLTCIYAYILADKKH